MSFKSEEQKQQDIEHVRGWVDKKQPTLPENARKRAAEFGASVWKGQMGVGEAADIGIAHVTSDIVDEPVDE